jgi:heat shock protein HslJ
MKPALLLLPLALAACTPASDADKTASQPATASAAPALADYHWQLSDAVDGQGQRLVAMFGNAGQPLQLDFSGDRINVSNACNRIGGGYSLAGGRLVTTPLVQTMMACAEPALMQRETTIKAVLQAQPTLTVMASAGAPQLVLAGADKTLSFTGQPTAQTRYGSAGSVEFLEVAAAPAPCSNPPAPATDCLEVRQLHYGDDGLRHGEPGAWQTLAQAIEGYTHQPGVRNVLRVKRYTLAQPPAGAASTAYVLDMVVESETVTPRH